MFAISEFAFMSGLFFSGQDKVTVFLFFFLRSIVMRKLFALLYLSMYICDGMGRHEVPVSKLRIETNFQRMILTIMSIN